MDISNNKPGEESIMMLNRAIKGFACFCFIFLVPPWAAMAQHTFTEDFTTVTYQDSAHTTADWDTAAGELKLRAIHSTKLGQYGPATACIGVDVDGDHAFLACHNGGIEIIDISNLESPVLLSSQSTSGVCRSVVVDGDYLYAAVDNMGLEIYDITDPADPTLLGALDTDGYAYGITFAGNHVFLACDHVGLILIDISDPTKPTIESTMSISGRARGVVVASQIAYVAGLDGGIYVFDVSLPSSPVQLAVLPATSARGVALSGNFLYVADYSSGVRVIDITNPSNPVQVGLLPTNDLSIAVSVSGDRLFISDYTEGLSIADIGDPTTPAIIDVFDTSSYAYDVAVSGDIAFVADYSSGLQVVRISEPIQPKLAGSCDFPVISASNYMDVCISGNYAYVADGDGGLQVVDISNPASPMTIGSYDGITYAKCIYVEGDYAYVANHGFGLYIFDISDPANPALTSSFDPGSALDVMVAGDHAYIASLSGLDVIDISDPTLPTLAGSCSTPDWATGIDVAGDYAYLADGSVGLEVFDISDPTLPVLVGSCTTPGEAVDVCVAGNYAYVADEVEGLQVIDISDPTSPTLVAGSDSPTWARSVDVSGNFVYVASLGGGLKVIDITDPVAPVLAQTYSTTAGYSNICVSGNFAYLARANSSSRELQSIEICQDRYDTINNRGESIEVDGADDALARYRLTTNQTAGVSWQLSFTGFSFYDVTPNPEWARCPSTGSSLRWRSKHTVPFLKENPTAYSLTLDWLFVFAPIDSITDVPDDQGGSVRINLSRSGYDFLDETVSPVTGYQIYQRIDIETDSASRDGSKNSLDLTAAGFHVEPMEGVHTWNVENRIFSTAVDKAGNFPTGTWEAVGWVAARQSDSYTIRVTPTAISTATDTSWSVYLITTHTTTPSVWFTCHPDSGYSVDNLAPGTPQNIQANYQAGGVALDWDNAPEVDFQYYRVYRGSDPGFVPSPDNLLHQASSSEWDDQTFDPWGYYYKITTLDYSGNESEAGLPAQISGALGEAVPARTALLGSAPNPFNPQTTISFELAEQGAVTLQVFDLSGRLVKTFLNNEVCPQGRNEATWNGRDDTGRMVASGTYFYRLKAGNYSDTKSLVLIK